MDRPASSEAAESPQRLACVDVPALPLQLLLARHPDWREHPAVVVDRDHPQGRILWTNTRARHLRIRDGMRYAAGLALARDLQAGTVSDTEIADGVSHITEALRAFTPGIEPAGAEASFPGPDAGVFWLDASGLGRLYPSLTRWARTVHEGLRARELHARIVVGFTRFGTYAVARASQRSVHVFETPEREREVALQVPLERLALAPALRDRLERLGVRSVEALLALPASGLRRRFGAEAFRLYEFARGSLWTPFRPALEAVEYRHELQFEPAERDVHRLLFSIKPALSALLGELAGRAESLVELVLELRLERGARRGTQEPRTHTERIRTAAPTRDERQILNLVHLRLEGLSLDRGITDLCLVLHAVREDQEQLALFRDETERDLQAGGRALARLRAEFGEQSVVKATLREAHLPEAHFHFEPVQALTRPNPRHDGERLLVRRMLAQPVRLPPRPRHEPDGWLLLGGRGGAVARREGPYVVSGGWWAGLVHREYHFVEMQSGELCWVYYDRKRRRWLLHGLVD